MHASGVHTPLVPLVSALLMVAFGESRVVAESVLPLSTAVWLLATYAVVRRLYDRQTARWTTALVSCFPVFLIYSRTYLLEHPLAALFSCACWALLATDRFRHALPSAGFGALAGLTALARGGGSIFVVGPVLVTLASIRGEPDRAKRAINCLLALLVGVAIAATWYGPNLGPFYDYVARATYGEDAVLRTGAAEAFSLESARYYLTWLVAQGPGVPMLAVVLVAWGAGALTGPRGRRGAPVATALVTAFVIDFVLLLIVAQRQTARYFQPLMPLIALAVVRTIAGVPQVRLRRLLGVIVAALAVHHVVALSLTFPLQRQSNAAPYFRGFPLWDHRTHFRGMVDAFNLRTPHDDFKIAETIDALAALSLRSDAVIGTFGVAHAFYQANSLRLAAVRRGMAWNFEWWPPLDPGNPARAISEAPLPSSEAILVRWGGPTNVPLAAIVSSAPILFDPVVGQFERVAELELGDGSHVIVLKRKH